MIQFHQVLETITKYAFCITEIKSTKGDGSDETKQTKKPSANIILLIILSNIFEWIDIINLILDLIFVFTKLIGKKEHLGKGITMLIGLVLARFMARRGHILKQKGGLQQWAPFCRPRRRQNEEYYQQNPRAKERNDTLSILYCITFTELSVFFLEDATMIIIWLTTAEFDPSDTWDLMNSWMTITSAIITMSLLLLSMFYSSIECHMFYHETRQRLIAAGGGFWRTIGIVLHVIVTFFIRLVCSILYTLCFFIIIIGYFIFLLWLVIRVIHMGLDYPIKLEQFFYVLVFFAWAIALYFVVQLFYRTSFKQQDENNHPPQSTSQHSSSHSIHHPTTTSPQSIDKDSNHHDNHSTTSEKKHDSSFNNISIVQQPNNDEENQISLDQSPYNDEGSRTHESNQMKEEMNTTPNSTTQQDDESTNSHSHSHRQVILKQNSLHIQEIEIISKRNDISTCTLDCHDNGDDENNNDMVQTKESNTDIEKDSKEETNIDNDEISIPIKNNHEDQTTVSSTGHKHNKEDCDIEIPKDMIENNDSKHQIPSELIESEIPR